MDHILCTSTVLVFFFFFFFFLQNTTPCVILVNGTGMALSLETRGMSIRASASPASD